MRLSVLPPNLPAGDESLPIKAIFEKYVGQIFTVSGFNEIGWAELLIERLTGSVGETIWVEPQLLQLIPKR